MPAISIMNSGFEAEDLKNGKYTFGTGSGPVEDWALIGGSGGVYNPKNNNEIDNISDDHIAYIYDAGAALEQQLAGYTYNSNEQITFSVDIGDPDYEGAQDYALEIVVNGAVIGSSTGNTGDNDALFTASVVSTVSNPALNGEIVTVRIVKVGFDNQELHLDNALASFENTVVVCFAAGTMIKTPYGDRPIENLCVGDQIFVHNEGLQVIRWIHSDLHPIDGDDDYPILIKAGALGDGVPYSDIIVSPQHRILVGETGQLEHLFDMSVLVPAKSLISLPGIRKMRGRKEIHWWHFACDNHGIVTANGAKTENLLLGKMVLNGLPKNRCDELLSYFGTNRLHQGALNGMPARPLLGAGKVKRILDQKKLASELVVPPTCPSYCKVM